MTITLTLFSAEVFSEENVTENTILVPGRFQLSGAASSDTGVFSGDYLQPFFLNQTNFIYGDLAADYATDDTYLVSPGMGYRGIVNNKIFGAYVFSDYEKTNLGENFWVLSPGVEWMTPQWDAHLNFYFPTTHSQTSGSPVYASTLGDYDNVAFEDGTHNQYDMLVQPYATLGNGVDAEIGYSFAGENHLKSRVYIGDYYYQPTGDTENILGVTAGYQQALSRNMSFSVFNSYDQVNRYAFGVGLTVTFGGNSNEYSSDVKERLLDPVERHIGIINTGAGTYDQQTTENLGQGLQYDNVYFTSADGTGDGTYGNSMALTQSNLDMADENNPEGSHIYVQGGDDAVYTVDSATATETDLDDAEDLGLYVHNGQEINGRTSDYTAPANGNDQPQIEADTANGYNAFVMNNNQENTFSNLSITASAPGNGTGIVIYNTDNNNEYVTINNTTISQFNTGVYANNSSSGNLTINTNSAYFINNTGTGVGATAYGMNVFNSGLGSVILNLNTSHFNDNTATGSGAGVQAAGLAVNNQDEGDIIVNATEAEFNHNAATGGDDSMAVGLSAFNASSGNIMLNTTRSQFNDNTSDYQALGLEAVNNSTGSMTITAWDSSFNDNQANVLGVGLYGANLSSGNLSIDSADSSFANNTGEYGYGIDTYNPGSGSFTVRSLNAYFSGNTTEDEKLN